MIISKEQIERIKKIIENRYNYLIFKMAGPSELTDDQLKDLVEEGLIDSDDGGLLKEAYYIGNVRGVSDPRTRSSIKLDDFKRQHKDKAIPITDAQKFAIEHIERSGGNYISNLKSKAISNVESLINDNNLQYRNQILEEQVRPVLTDAVEQNRTIMQIAADLRDSTGDMFRDWKRVATTEMTNAMNLGELDGIVSRNKGKPLNNVYVYKRVNHDDATCSYCKKAYLKPDGTPKVFTVEQLQENGSNYGLKAVDWKPTIGPLHPNCRCALVQLPDGWGFDKDTSQMIFVSPNYIHYRDSK